MLTIFFPENEAIPN